MKCLLDTAPFLWMLFDDQSHISEKAMAIMADKRNTLILSAASTWEIAIKYSLGKLKLKSPPSKWLYSLIDKMDVQPLPIHMRHTLALAAMPYHHKDPFDRLLVAQAKQEQLAVITPDAMFSKYGIKTIWE